MAETTFRTWKKKHPHNFYVKQIKSEQQFQSLRKEILSLTNNGNYESVYEFAQMEGCDMDDVFKLIGIY